MTRAGAVPEGAAAHPQRTKQTTGREGNDMNQVLEQLKKEALYAQRSFSTELLYQTYGKAQMASQLGALTFDEFMEINEMTVRYMNTDREYIREKNREFFDNTRFVARKPT